LLRRAPEDEHNKHAAESIVAVHIVWEEQTGKLADEDVASKASEATSP
jgi:hypothetical protein